MRIAFLIHNLNSGGAERATCALSGYFASKGHEVSILTIDGDKPFYSLDERVNLINLNLPKIKTGSPVKKTAAVLRRFSSIQKSIRALNPDVVIGMSHVMSVYAVFSTRRSGIKAIGTERNNPYTYQNTAVMRFLRRFCSKSAEGFVYQTKRAMAFFPAAAQKKSAVIPNAVFNPLVEEIHIAEQRSKTITAMGRLTYQKGFDILINAFAKIAADIPEYTLVIYGKGNDKDALEKLIDEHGLTGRVLLPGTSPDAIKKVAGSSVFVLSSRLEGMPNALMEAMACGVPCISTNCPMGPEELIEDGVNGILIPVDDAGALAESMLKILTDGDFAAKLAANAYKLRETHSVESVGECWLSYIDKIVNG